MRTTAIVLALSANLGACGQHAAAVAQDNRSVAVAGENPENGALVAAEHAWVGAAMMVTLMAIPRPFQPIRAAMNRLSARNAPAIPLPLARRVEPFGGM